ncbi:MFS transporter [Brachybacterium subflavum]|uniref:MFS transporter n=1 Tax=Brachybacterium subflavum TaxID=2585206 RepID=UPI0012663F2D|nr:MFS transporter [Brachybacterium subflavum]
MTAPAASSLWDRIGLPRPLLFGYIAVLLFMIGDGVESNFITPFLVDTGLTEHTAAAVITVYGVFTSVGAWFSGTLSNIWSPVTVMRIGAIAWIILEAAFLLLAVPAGNEPLIFALYGLRGVAYPLFAYAFLLWIQVAVRPEHAGGASGWFWFAYTAGLPTLGSALAAVTIPQIGSYATLWVAFVIVAAGGVIGAWGVREVHGWRPLADRTATDFSVAHELGRGVTVMRRYPRLAVAAVVRVINMAPYFGFFVFFPFYFTERIGLTTSQYLLVVTAMGLFGLLADPFLGRLGDVFGWRRTVTWIGSVGSAVAVIALYWIPQLTPGVLWVPLVLAGVYGITLAGFIPLTAMMTSMVPLPEKGNAMATYSLAAGLCVFIGPVTYSLLGTALGYAGVVLVYAGLYVLAAVLTHRCLRTPADPGENRRQVSGKSFTPGDAGLRAEEASPRV